MGVTWCACCTLLLSGPIEEREREQLPRDPPIIIPPKGNQTRTDTLQNNAFFHNHSSHDFLHGFFQSLSVLECSREFVNFAILHTTRAKGF